MNTFVQMRNYVLNKSDKTKEIEELKTMLLLHIKNTDNKFKQTDKTIQNIINVLNNFIEKPRETKHIGF